MLHPWLKGQDRSGDRHRATSAVCPSGQAPGDRHSVGLELVDTIHSRAAPVGGHHATLTEIGHALVGQRPERRPDLGVPRTDAESHRACVTVTSV
ncbi:hypothetical protein D9M68_541840 [compost metagenome]